jgi:hypothetical protein
MYLSHSVTCSFLYKPSPYHDNKRWNWFADKRESRVFALAWQEFRVLTASHTYLMGTVLFYSLSRGLLLSEFRFSTNTLSFCEPGSSVSIVSGYGQDDRAIGIRSPAEAKGFLL